MSQAEPSLAASNNGELLVVWMDFTTEQPHLRWAASLDHGATFTESRPLLDDAAHNRGQADPSVVRTADGVIRVAFLGCRAHPRAPKGRACDAWVMRTADLGKTWSAPVALASGDALRADRPWLSTDGTRVFGSWTEELDTGPPTWAVAEERADGSFETRTVLERTKSYDRVLVEGDKIDAWLLLRSPSGGTPTHVSLSHQQSRDGAKSFTEVRRYEVEASHIVVKLSVGALAPDGDVVLPAPTDTLHWIEDNVVAWMQRDRDGWRVKVRCRDRRGTTDLNRKSFKWAMASKQLFVGDFLDVKVAGSDLYVAWSDTSDGDADVYVARGRCR